MKWLKNIFSQMMFMSRGGTQVIQSNNIVSDGDIAGGDIIKQSGGSSSIKSINGVITITGKVKSVTVNGKKVYG